MTLLIMHVVMHASNHQVDQDFIWYEYKSLEEALLQAYKKSFKCHGDIIMMYWSKCTNLLTVPKGIHGKGITKETNAGM